MPSIPAGFVEGTFVFSVTGQPRKATWSLGFDFNDFNILTPDQMAQEIHIRFTDAAGPYVNTKIQTGWTYEGVSVIKQLEDGPLVGSYYSSVVGTMATAPVPNNCAILMTKITGTGGRRGRGRAFLPPIHITEGAVDGAGMFTSGQAASILAYYNAVRIDCAADGFPWQLYHATAPFTPSPITGLTMSNQMATQRRRMRK